MSKIIKILAGLIIVVIITFVVVISLIDVNQYRDDVVTIVEEKTGRQFNIGGDFNFALSLIPTVLIEDISFGNAEWGSEPDMLKVGQLEVEVSLLPLLSGTVKVNRLILNSPEILLETNEQGEGNWVLPLQSDEEPAEGPAELPGFAIDIISITDAKITYRDGRTGKVTNVTVDDITIDGGGLDDPIVLSMNASYNSIPVTLNGEIGAPEQLIDNENYPLRLTATISDAVFGIEGQVAKPLEARGLDLALSFQVQTTRSLSKLAESELPDIGPVEFSGRLADTETGYVLRPFTLNAGKSDLNGDITVSVSGDKPSLVADLHSDLLDLASFTGEEQAEQEKTGKDPAARVFPSDPLPLESLHSADVQISMDVKKIHTNAADLDNTRLIIKIENGIFSIDPLDTTLAGGTFKYALTLDGSNRETALLALNLDINNLQPGLLPDLQGKITDARTNVSLNARGRGGSVAEIMAGLNGKLLVQTGPGVYRSEKKKEEEGGILSKTFGLLKPKGEAEQGTQIECLVVNLDITDGISSIDRRIGLATDKIDVLGSGSLDFRSEELDIGVAPQAREGIGISANQLAELVRLKGTFANPTVGTDTKAAFKAGLSAGAAVATGGISLLAQGLFNKSTATSDPCNIALGKEPEQSAAAEEDKSTTEKTVDTVKDVGESIKDKLKGLFGR